MATSSSTGFDQGHSADSAVEMRDAELGGEEKSQDQPMNE
jgi:hypothetical protein